MVLIKIHETYRKIVAVCDKELVGKKFEQGNLQLDVNDNFYGGKEFNDSDALEILKDELSEDACFNFVGKNAIELGAKAGVINKKRVLMIQDVPHAMALL
jgi:hypothetical protein